MSSNCLETARVNFIRLQRKVKLDKKVIHSQDSVGFFFQGQDHSQWSKVSLRGFCGGGGGGHLLHFVTFLVLNQYYHNHVYM